MKRKVARAAIAPLLLFPVALPAAQADRAEPPQDAPILDVPADGKVELSVDGVAITAFAGPGMPTAPYLRRTVARSLFGADADVFDQQRGFSLFSIGRATDARIGPVRVRGRDRAVRLRAADIEGAGYVRWFERDAYPFGDALAGPWAIPAPVIRFRLHAPTGDEREVALPLAERRRWWLAATVLPIGGKDVILALAPQFPTTVTSAAAGAAIVGALGGRFAGPAEPTVISYGVTRPTRPVRLLAPLRLGPLSLDAIRVRTADYGSAGAIADPAESDPAETPGDVVVKGKRRKTRPSYIVYVGADALAGCASITYNKPARQITLACSAPGSARP